MRGVAQNTLLMGFALVIGLTACSDLPDRRATQDDISGIHAVVNPACDEATSISNGVKAFFNVPQKQTAIAAANDISAACRNSDQGTLTSHSLNLIKLIETVHFNGTAANLSAGPALVNALLACSTSLCVPAANPGLNLAAAFSTYGLFALRGADKTPAIARAAIPFTDSEGQSNSVLWGVETVNEQDKTWSEVVTGTAADAVLVYGGQPQTGLSLGAEDFGIPQYELNVHPNLPGPFPGGQLFVGTCFAQPVEISDDTEARIRRENVILEFHEPTFCGSTATQTASIAAPFLALASRVMPDFVRSLFVRGQSGGPGCGALDFSRFGAVAVNANAFLEFLVAPPANVLVGETFDVQIRAFSSTNTPMERALVELYILNNQGQPAGAELGGVTTAFTVEQLDKAGIATFTGVSVGKPGGYRICARATLDGFTFADVCATTHVKNAD